MYAFVGIRLRHSRATYDGCRRRRGDARVTANAGAWPKSARLKGWPPHETISGRTNPRKRVQSLLASELQQTCVCSVQLSPRHPIHHPPVLRARLRSTGPYWGCQRRPQPGLSPTPLTLVLSNCSGLRLGKLPPRFERCCAPPRSRKGCLDLTAQKPFSNGLARTWRASCRKNCGYCH
jgi:hypothetical protein